MSSSLTTPPSPPPTTPPPPATEATPSFPSSVAKAFRDLPHVAKFALLGLVILLLIGLYIWTGYVTTDDAQVDAHITAVASQVSGYVVSLAIDDNVDVKEGDVLV